MSASLVIFIFDQKEKFGRQNSTDTESSVDRQNGYVRIVCFYYQQFYDLKVLNQTIFLNNLKRAHDIID